MAIDATDFQILEAARKLGRKYKVALATADIAYLAITKKARPGLWITTIVRQDLTITNWRVESRMFDMAKKMHLLAIQHIEALGRRPWKKLRSIDDEWE